MDARIQAKELVFLDVKPKWYAFARVIQCPACGDTGGHAGISSDGTAVYCVKCTHRARVIGKDLPFETSSDSIVTVFVPESSELQLIDSYMNAVYAELPYTREETVEYFVNQRGFDEELAHYMYNRGYVIYNPGKKIALDAEPDVCSVLAHHPVFSVDQRTRRKVLFAGESSTGLLFPVYSVMPGVPKDLLSDFRFRYISEDRFGRGKYKWLKKSSNGGHLFGRPKYTFVSGVLDDALVVVEGEIKAEVAAYTIGFDTIGLTSGGLMQYVNAFVSELTEARPSTKYSRIIIASDSDVFNENPHIALGTIKGFLALRAMGYLVTFYLWPTAPKSKGIDDFLLEEKEDPFEGLLSDWLAQCSPSTLMEIHKRYKDDPFFREAASDTKIVTLLDSDLDSLSARKQLTPVQITDDTERIDHLCSLFFDKNLNVVIDTSATGVGKTYGIAEHYDRLNEAGFNRVVYISQSPLNPPISSMENWPILMGRSQFGYRKLNGKYKERTPEEAARDKPEAEIPANCTEMLVRELATGGMHEFVSVYCNNLCTSKEVCPFIAQRERSIRETHLRTSKQSYFPIPGDLVILDERTTLAPFNTYTISEEVLENAGYYLRTNLDVLEKALKVPAAFVETKLLGRVELVTRHLLARVRSWKKKGVAHVAAYDIRKKLELDSLQKEVAMDLQELLRDMDRLLDMKALQQADKYISPKETKGILVDASIADSGVPKRLQELKKAIAILMLACALKGGRGVSFAYAGEELLLRYRDIKLQEAILDYAKRGEIKVLILDATATFFEYQSILGNVRADFVSYAKGQADNEVRRVLVTGLRDTYQTTRKAAVATNFKRMAGLIPHLADRYGIEKPVAGIITHKKFEHIAQASAPRATGHWGLDERGSNAYFNAGCNMLMVAGAPLPNLAVLVADTEILFDKAMEPGAGITSRGISDADFLRLLKTQLDSAYTQAEGRLRANRRPGETLLMVLFDSMAGYVADDIVDITELLPPDEVLQLQQEKKAKKERKKQTARKNIGSHNKEKIAGKVTKDMQYIRKGREYAQLGGFYTNSKLLPELTATQYIKRGFPSTFREEVQRYVDNKRLGPLEGDIHPGTLSRYVGFVLAADAALPVPLYSHLPERVFNKLFLSDKCEVLPMSRARTALESAKHRNRIVDFTSEDSGSFGANLSDYKVMPLPTEELDKDVFYVPNLPDALRAIQQLKELLRADNYDYLSINAPRNDAELEVLRSRVLALDIETTKAEQKELRLFATGYEANTEKPNVGKDVIRIVSITHVPTGVTFAFDMWKILTGASRKVAQGFFQGLQKCLDVSLVMGHNLTFDMSYLQYHYQVEIPQPFCTFTLMHYLEAALYGTNKAYEKKHTLEKLVSYYLKKPLPKAMQRSNWGVPALTIEQKEYAAADTRIYTELYPKLKEVLSTFGSDPYTDGKEYYLERLLGANGLGDLHIGREMLVLIPLADMAAYGTPLDRNLIEDLLVDRTQKLDKVSSELVSLGIIAPTRNSQVFKWLVDFPIPDVEERLLNLDYEDEGTLLDIDEEASMDTKGRYTFDKKRRNKESYTVGEAALKNLQSYSQELLEYEQDPNLRAQYETLIRGIDSLLRHRSVSKEISKLKELKEYSIERNGHLRIHNALLSFGTATGRMSSREPNLQNISRGSDFRKLIAAEEGNVLVGADFPQIELRIASRLTSDKVMLDSFFAGIDLHKVTAATVAGVPLDKVTKENRQQAKAVNFGFLYGMGPTTMKEYAKQNYGVHMTLEEATAVREKYFALYSGLKVWHDKTRKQALVAVDQERSSQAKNQKRAITETISGRPICVLIGDFFKGIKLLYDDEGNEVGKMADYNVSAITRRLLNYADQGTGADMIKDALIYFYTLIRYEELDAHVVNVVHDEVLVECRESDRERVAELLRLAMQTVAEDILQGLPVPVDVASGSTWQDCH